MNVSLKISDECQRRLNTLSRYNETHSTVETLRRAIAVYDTCLMQIVQKDAKLILLYPNGEQKEVVVQ